MDPRLLPEEREFVDQRARDARWSGWRDERLNELLSGDVKNGNAGGKVYNMKTVYSVAGVTR